MIRLVHVTFKAEPNQPSGMLLAVATAEQLLELARILETSTHAVQYRVCQADIPGPMSPWHFGWTADAFPKWKEAR